MAEFPSFYNPSRIGTLFYPDVKTIAVDANLAGLLPSIEDKKKVHLLIVDMQIDFCHENGTLYVPGAIDDIRHLIEFIYKNAAHITSISCTLDSHLPFQIFHPAWWADEAGNNPPPFTVITEHDLVSGKWRPLIAAKWSTSYLRRLSHDAKKELVIWPYHVPIGGIGNALDPELWSSIFWHSIARRSQPTWFSKGSLSLTEHYSIIKPEVPVPDQPSTDKNQAILDLVEHSDTFIIAGEAESHCVLETVEDLADEFRQNPKALNKIHVLRDCMSPVRHPEIDFHSIAQKQFAEFEKRGIHLVESKQSLPY